MRINRGKAIRKYLRFYRIVFGLEDPFHVILDGNFIFNAMKYQVDIFDRFKTQMQGAELNFYMTKSAMLELQKVKGDVGKQSVEWAEKFCNGINDDEYTSIGKGETPAEKLISFLQHRHHEWVRNPVMNETERNSKEQRKYFVATQDKTLRQSLAGIPGIPLVYLNSVAFVMEPPSEKSKTFNAEVEKSKINAISASEAKVVDAMVNKKRKRGLEDNIVGASGRGGSGAGASKSEGEGTISINIKDRFSVKHKAKAANPLSSQAPTEGSKKQKKMKAGKFKR